MYLVNTKVTESLLALVTLIWSGVIPQVFPVGTLVAEVPPTLVAAGGCFLSVGVQV